MSSFEAPNNPHFDAIYSLLPSGLRRGIDDLLSRATRESTVRHTLDQLLRFSLDRPIAEHDPDSTEEWDSQRTKANIALSKLLEMGERKTKRALEDISDDNEGQKSKKIKLVSNETGAVDDTSIYTLMSLSSASPIRKKVNIAIHQDTIRFVNPASNTQEASMLLSSITRAFLVPTAGKAKPHWTVIMLTSTDQNQIIFGLDATPSSLTTISHSEAPKTHPKGTEAKPILKHFLSHLPSHIPLLEPSTAVFCSVSGEPFIDAYLRAKDGHVSFFEDGILFGEKKPCLWIGLNEIKNVRTLSATGRTFSIFITCLADAARKEEDEDAEGEEIEFSLIDGKNQDAVSQWIRNNQDKFGVQKSKILARDKESTTMDAEELTDNEETPEKKNDARLSDEEDSDYESDSSSDGGSATSSSSEAEDDEGEGEGEDGEGEDDAESEGEDGDEEDLDPVKHPLLAPGAVPRMSKAAIHAVINMVEDDLLGKAKEGPAETDELEDEEVDELE